MVYDLAFLHWQLYSMINSLLVLWSKIKICPLKWFKCEEMVFFLLILSNILLATPPAGHCKWWTVMKTATIQWAKWNRLCTSIAIYIHFLILSLKQWYEVGFLFPILQLWKPRFREGTRLTHYHTGNKWKSRSQTQVFPASYPVFFIPHSGRWVGI